MENSGKSYSIAGLILGIASCALSFVMFVNLFAIASGVVGIVMSIKARKLTVADGLPTGMCTAGLILSIVGTALSVIGFATCTVCTTCVGLLDIW